MSYFLSTPISGKVHFWRYHKANDTVALEYFSDPQQEFLKTHPTQAGRECRFNFHRVPRSKKSEIENENALPAQYRISAVDALHDFRVLRTEKGKRATFIDLDTIEDEINGETLFEAKPVPKSSSRNASKNENHHSASPKQYIFQCVATGLFLSVNPLKYITTSAGEDRAAVFTLDSDLGTGPVVANRMPYNIRIGHDDLFINCEEGKPVELSHAPTEAGLFVLAPYKTMWRDQKNTFVLGLCSIASEQPKLSLHLSIQQGRGKEDGDSSAPNKPKYHFAAKRMYEMNAWDEFELVPVEGNLSRFIVATAGPLPGTNTRLMLGVDRRSDDSSDNWNHSPIAPLPFDESSLKNAFYFVPREFPPSDDPGRDDLPPIGHAAVDMGVGANSTKFSTTNTLTQTGGSGNKARRIAALILFCVALVALVGFSISNP